MADQFPEDITYNILSRLPIKSLARLRCVCKLWLKYINNPYLETIHHVKDELKPIMFQKHQSVHNNKINDHCKISFLRVTQATSTLKKDHIVEFCYKDSNSNHLNDQEDLVLGSCNGLTLVSYEKEPSRGTFQLVAVINPLCKQRYKLPPLKIDPAHFKGPLHLAAGIGFDDSANTLKTVCVILKESVYSLPNNVIGVKRCTMIHYSGWISWREIPRIPAYPITGESVFAHGRLHWLTSSFWRKVVWFDLKMEEFGLIEAPILEGLLEGNYEWVKAQLVDLNGEVGLACITATRFELWIWKQEEWALHCRFDLNMSRYSKVVVAGCWNKDGDILFTSNELGMHIYTLKTGDLQHVDWGDQCCTDDIRMYRSNLFLIRASAYFVNKRSNRRKKCVN